MPDVCVVLLQAPALQTQSFTGVCWVANFYFVSFSSTLLNVFGLLVPTTPQSLPAKSLQGCAGDIGTLFGYSPFSSCLVISSFFFYVSVIFF